MTSQEWTRIRKETSLTNALNGMVDENKEALSKFIKYLEFNGFANLTMVGYINAIRCLAKSVDMEFKDMKNSKMPIEHMNILRMIMICKECHLK